MQNHSITKLETKLRKIIVSSLQLFRCYLKLKKFLLSRLACGIVPIIKTKLVRRRLLGLMVLRSGYYFGPTKNLFRAKQIIVDYKDYRPIASSLEGIIAFAWLCEKMKVSIKIKPHTTTVLRHFENDTITNNIEKQRDNLEKGTESHFHNDIAWFAILTISSEYGHKVLSKLSIKAELKKAANQWADEYLREEWVAVHYRGTDIRAKRKTRYKARYKIHLDPYITYLKAVLNNQCKIFACSDQAQFINKMHEAFPRRVVARDIKRSYDDTSLHVHGSYENIDTLQQEKDAIIDILILAKAKLIYTTGSGFVDVVRYFNPKTKIISLDERIIGLGSNCLPIPEKDLFSKLRIKRTIFGAER